MVVLPLGLIGSFAGLTSAWIEQNQTTEGSHEGGRCDQADVEASVATHCRQLHKGFPENPAEDQARDIILRNVEELTDKKRITTVLQFDGPFSDQIRQTCMLEAFVNRPDWSASEQDIVESLSRLEQDVIDAAAAEDSLRYEDPDRIEILKDVLKTALEDNRITFRELNLLRTLRDSLGMSEAVFRIVLAQLEHFPQQATSCIRRASAARCSTSCSGGASSFIATRPTVRPT